MFDCPAKQERMQYLASEKLHGRPTPILSIYLKQNNYNNDTSNHLDKGLMGITAF